MEPFDTKQTNNLTKGKSRLRQDHRQNDPPLVSQLREGIFSQTPAS